MFVANVERAPAGAHPSPRVPQDALVLDAYLPLVRAIAAAFARRGAHHPAGLEFDDLVGFGVVGLCQAARRFDPTRAVEFSTFAYTRIRGEIADAITTARRWPLSQSGEPSGCGAWRIEVEKIEAHLDFTWNVGKAVDRLCAIDAALVRACFLEERSNAAAGREVGLSRSYAGRRLASALTRLRKRLAAKEVA